MPQRDLLLPWLSALDNAGAGAARARRRPRPGARARRRRGWSASAWRGSSSTRPAQLSGGMRQRVSFLRSLLAGKPVLALDEPFASLDAITRAEMQGWLAQVLATEPRTVVLVTHDVEEAVVLGDRVVVMSRPPGPRGRRDRGRRWRGRGGGPTPRWWRCASGCSRRWGCAHETRWPARSALAAALAAGRGAARRLGAVRRPRRRRPARSCPPPTRSPSRCTTTARCCGATSWSPPRRCCSGSSSPRSRRWRWRA